MKMTTLRTHVAVLALAVLALSTAGRAQYDRPSRAPAGDPVAVPMTADHWERSTVFHRNRSQTR
jgi:hypothetical protein